MIEPTREQLEERNDQLEGALYQIQTWINAYPLEVFPEPDLKKARQLLKTGGMTLDAISASNMRHVLKGIAKIIEEAKL